MPESYTDDNGNRILIRHAGPAGRGIPAGGTTGKILVKASGTNYDTAWATPPNGTNAVGGPISSVNGNFALFDGITGKLIKDSGRALTYYASASLVATKEDKVVGKGLSEANFTTVEKTKLGNLAAGGFRGSFDNSAAIGGFTFTPVPRPGDYCYIEKTGDEIIEVLWDSVNGVWTEQVLPPVTMTGDEIAFALFESTDSVSYNQNDCRIFTSGEKATLAAHGALISALTGVTTVLPAYGSLAYFNLTGTAVTIAVVSDGSSNMVKVNVASTVAGLSTLFDNGGSSNGRLRYTGTATRVFHVTAKVAFTGATTDVLVFGLAKNASLDLASRGLKAMDATGTVDSLTLSALVSLATNDYIEVFVGNTTDISGPTVSVLSIEVTPA